MPTSEEIRAYKQIKSALSNVKDGTHVESPRTIKLWGCKTCSFYSTPLCPHGMKNGKYFKNHICPDRILYIKERMQVLNSVPRMIQEEEIMKDILVKDKLIQEFVTGGELHPDLHKFSRNVQSALKNLRQQNEGINISGEINFSSHDDFRKMIDIEAKKIQERDNSVRQGEFTEEVPPG